MFINIANAQEATESITITPPSDTPIPDPGVSVMSNIAFVLMIVVMFYFLLIRPQQKRFKEHAGMLEALKKGDKVVTGGGLVGKIDKVNKDEGEAIIDLGNGTKVTSVLANIQRKVEKPSKTSK